MLWKGSFNMLKSLVSMCLSLKSDKRAVTAIEYALIAALIAVVIIGAVTTLGSGVSNTFNSVASEL
jgi:pilus assembly protein Flp/PilA